MERSEKVIGEEGRGWRGGRLLEKKKEGGIKFCRME